MVFIQFKRTKLICDALTVLLVNVHEKYLGLNPSTFYGFISQFILFPILLLILYFARCL